MRETAPALQRGAVEEKQSWVGGNSRSFATEKPEGRVHVSMICANGPGCLPRSLRWWPLGSPARPVVNVSFTLWCMRVLCNPAELHHQQQHTTQSTNQPLFANQPRDDITTTPHQRHPVMPQHAIGKSISAPPCHWQKAIATSRTMTGPGTAATFNSTNIHKQCAYLQK